MKMVWTNRKQQYGIAMDLKVGGWTVGSVMWNSARAKNDPHAWKAVIRLPGLKPSLGAFVEEGDAKQRVEAVCKYWFDKVEEGSE